MTHKEQLEEIMAQGANGALLRHASSLVFDLTHGFEGYVCDEKTSGLIKRCDAAIEIISRIKETVECLNKRDSQST